MSTVAATCDGCLKTRPFENLASLGKPFRLKYPKPGLSPGTFDDEALVCRLGLRRGLAGSNTLGVAGVRGVVLVPFLEGLVGILQKQLLLFIILTMRDYSLEPGYRSVFLPSSKVLPLKVSTSVARGKNGHMIAFRPAPQLSPWSPRLILCCPYLRLIIPLF